jgi:hypothetical protein
MSIADLPADQSELLIEIAFLTRRAGLRLTATELVEIVEPYARLQAGLRALRADLDAVEEPASTFDAAASWDDADGHADQR